MVNIKISRVKHNLLLMGMEFSYVFFQTSHFSKGLHFLRFVRGIRCTYNRHRFRLYFASSFLLCAPAPSQFSLPLQSTRNI